MVVAEYYKTQKYTYWFRKLTSLIADVVLNTELPINFCLEPFKILQSQLFTLLLKFLR